MEHGNGGTVMHDPARGPDFLLHTSCTWVSFPLFAIEKMRWG